MNNHLFIITLYSHTEWTTVLVQMLKFKFWNGLLDLNNSAKIYKHAEMKYFVLSN